MQWNGMEWNGMEWNDLPPRVEPREQLGREEGAVHGDAPVLGAARAVVARLVVDQQVEPRVARAHHVPVLVRLAEDPAYLSREEDGSVCHIHGIAPLHHHRVTVVRAVRSSQRIRRTCREKRWQCVSHQDLAE